MVAAEAPSPDPDPDREPEPDPDAAASPLDFAANFWEAVTALANFRNVVSNMATSRGEAPFCGPNTALAPFGPKSGLSTSNARRNVVSSRRGSMLRRSTAARFATPPGNGGISRP